MESAILDIIQKSQLPNNEIRLEAEQLFFQAVETDPSSVANALISLSLNTQMDIITKQSTLIYLKRAALTHWSIGHSNFVGNPINQETKKVIRSNLLRLVCQETNTKLKNIVSNLIVTIAVVDYPDEWPDLLSALYSFIDQENPSSTEVSLLGGLQVLYDLFDELVTEEQFFEGMVGVQTLDYCVSLLSAPSVSHSNGPTDKIVPLVVKNHVARLFEIALKQLQGPGVFNHPQRSQYANNFLPKALDLVFQLLKDQYVYTEEILTSNVNILNIENIKFGHKLYEILSYMVDNYNKRLFNSESKSKIQDFTINHINNLKKFYYNLEIANNAEKIQGKFIVYDKLDDQSDKDPTMILNELITQMVQLLGSLSDTLLSSNPNLSLLLLENLVILNTIPTETYEMYVDNFNLFVTDETEMSGQFTVRNSVSDYLSEVPAKDSIMFLESALSLLNNMGNDWKNKEAILSILESIFLNEDDEEIAILPSSTTFEGLLNKLVSFIVNTKENPMVICRGILVIAKYLQKFGNDSKNNELFYNTLINNLGVAVNIKNDSIIQSEGVIDDETFDKESNDCIKMIQSAALISLTYFNNFLNFNNSNFNHQIQKVIHEIMHFLVDEAEDDTPAVLLEALTISINIDLIASQNGTDDMMLIFKIAGVDFSNILNVQTAKDSLETLLTSINENDYLKQCEFGLPTLIEILQENDIKEDTEDFPKLNMALELLAIFIQFCPNQENLPKSLFDFVYAPLTSVLINATDDQILQIGGEVFNTVLNNTNKEHFINLDHGLQITLQILEKFLSPSLSDSAAMNVGSIVVSIVKKFNEDLSQYIPQILESATRRLIIAKSTIIVDNLITVFCYLVLISPKDTLDFLGSLTFNEPKSNVNKNGIEIVLPIWLESFSTTRGYEGIKQNIKALTNLFLLKDSRIENLIVKGDIIVNPKLNPDIIITRSMAKKMPTLFSQISASLKIIKLLIQELTFQNQQEISNEVVVAEGAEEEGGWEDVDELSNFNKLKDYVETDSSSKLNDKSSQDLKGVIVGFFKQCIQADSEHFKKFFDQLSDNEKNIIAETMN